jgi:hypothetical protein
MKTLKTEHGGAKNGGGYWGTREEAKRQSRKSRRLIDKSVARSDEASADDKRLDGPLPEIRGLRVHTRTPSLRAFR